MRAVFVALAVALEACGGEAGQPAPGVPERSGSTPAAGEATAGGPAEARAGAEGAAAGAEGAAAGAEGAAAGAAREERFLGELRTRWQEAEASGTAVVQGEDGWLFFAPELRSLAVGQFWGEAAPEASRAPRPEDADPLPAILDFHSQLTAAGIELLFVPVPAKAAIYPEKIGGAVDLAPGEVPPRLDGAHGEFLRVLAERGVPVLDLLPLFLAERERGAPLYCRHDTHWSPRACALTARRIAREVADRPWLAASERRAFAVEERTIAISGDLWRMLPEPRPPREELAAWFVGEETPQGLEPPHTERTSPVLLLGDSHTLVFHAGGDLHAVGAGLVDHLAQELGFPIDLIGVRGSGATPSRVNLLRRSDGLAGKRLVVWCMSVREYTEGQGWKLVPVTAPRRE